jgi:tRNA dimethylallyltransferase
MGQNKSDQPIVAIVGPTCTGKTWLSLRLAEQLKTEIVACDSRTIYKYMDIGTAKVTPSERAQVRHHMLDLIEPDQIYTVARYKDDTQPVIENLIENGKSPIVVGGTGFYFRNLLEGLSIPRVPPQKELRQELTEIANNKGNAELHAKLEAVDPASARRINANDRFRVIRALEVYMVEGRPFSELAIKSMPDHNIIWIGLFSADRRFMQDLIKLRLEKQMNDGFLNEVQSILARFGRCHGLTSTVGYKELLQYLESDIDLQEAIDLCARNTYKLARRQLMWFRSNRNIRWFSIDQLERDQILSEVQTIVSEARSKKLS